jgi:hypothetical protein
MLEYNTVGYCAYFIVVWNAKLFADVHKFRNKL